MLSKKLKGKTTLRASGTAKCDIVDWKRKKIITEEGERDLTDQEIRELSKKPGIRKTPI